MMKPVLISGIQPSGRLHIGNYLGALKNFVDLQNFGTYACYFFIADLHALTENPDAKELHENILNLAADFLAAGLDPKKCVLFQQSQIPAHTELAWTLSTIAPLGELERMTQFKDKALKSAMSHVSDKVISSSTPEDEAPEDNTIRTVREEIRKNINAGLLYYPMLMAADILLYDAECVPTGDDQDQHIELTRTLARKFNARFGNIFTEPKNLHTDAPRIMDLRAPEKKMSKSDPNGCLFLDDSPEEIGGKIIGATTDSHESIAYNPNERPGMSNLMQIYSSLTTKSLETIQMEFKGKGYVEFKTALAELIASHFADFRKKKQKLMEDPPAIRATLASGSAQANTIASKKIAEVKRRIGLWI